jgi:hypothetical protein
VRVGTAARGALLSHVLAGSSRYFSCCVGSSGSLRVFSSLRIRVTALGDEQSAYINVTPFRCALQRTALHAFLRGHFCAGVNEHLDNVNFPPLAGDPEHVSVANVGVGTGFQQCFYHVLVACAHCCSERRPHVFRDGVHIGTLFDQ